MEGKICLVTGASDGIGKATALGLARLGAQVVMVSRDPQRGQAALAEVKDKSGNPKHELLLADLSSLAEVRRLADEVQSRHPRLHVLVNNAGLALSRRTPTVDGLETVFVVNYLAPFLLTNLLLDRLKASAPARVVNVAGDFHRKATIRFDDLQSEKSYDWLFANNQAKLALIMFTYELSLRLAGSEVTANCLHPGPTATNSISRDPNLGGFARFQYSLFKPFFQSPEKGARTSVYLATSPEVEGISGKYFINMKESRSSEESYNQEIARRLWETSERLAGGMVA